MSDYRGKLRIFVTKTDEPDPKKPWEHGFEDHSYDHFDDRIISDVKDTASADILSTELDHCGIDMFIPQIKEILEPFQVGDTVEIMGDAHIEYHRCNAYCEPEEWDANYWMENIKTHKLTEDQVKRFVEIEAEFPTEEMEKANEPKEG